MDKTAAQRVAYVYWLGAGISCEDLKGSEAVSVGDWGDRSLELLEFRWAMTASTDKSSPLENVPDETAGSTATVAWPGQACAPQFDLHPKTVLFIMRYP